MYQEDARLQHILKIIEDMNIEKGFIVLDRGFFFSIDLKSDLLQLYLSNTIQADRVREDIVTAFNEAGQASLLIVSDLFYHGSLSELMEQVFETGNVRFILTDIINAGNRERVLRLFVGDGLDEKTSGFYTVRSVDNIMCRYGFCCKKIYDRIGENATDGYSYLMSENALICEYMQNTKKMLDVDSEISYMVRIYEKSNVAGMDKKMSATSDESECFLSIIMRTQGRRKTELEEALLCVYSQRDSDYEVLLMGHNLDEIGKETVNQIIADTPSSLSKKIRYIDVAGGTRTTPLIKGFEEARGKYVAIFDDDDIIFDNWVETFHKLAEKHYGKILHAYCARQDWIRIRNPYGGDGLRAIGPFEKMYCKDFDEIMQLSDNNCPIHSLAFPRSAYTNLGMRFDECLEVLEDWDFLMRCSFLCGVANAQEITSVYRIWRNTENAAAIHSQKEWNQTKKQIIDKFNQQAVLMPKNMPGKLAKMLDDDVLRHQYNTEENNRLWTFFVDMGDEKGFLPDRMTPRYVKTPGDGKFYVHYDELDKFGVVKGIRLDPGEDAWITVKDLEIKIAYVDGTRRVIDADLIKSNGLEYNDQLIFYTEDPQIIVIDDSEKGIISATLSGYIYYDLDDESRTYVGELMKSWKAAFDSEESRKKKNGIMSTIKKVVKHSTRK